MTEILALTCKALVGGLEQGIEHPNPTTKSYIFIPVSLDVIEYLHIIPSHYMIIA